MLLNQIIFQVDTPSAAFDTGETALDITSIAKSENPESQSNDESESRDSPTSYQSAANETVRTRNSSDKSSLSRNSQNSKKND